MEHMLSRLVDEFADGKISRRTLVQSLAAVLAGSAAISKAATPAGTLPRREFKAIAVNHISYQSKDYARARDFYAQNFGMKVLRDTGKQASLGFGKTTLIVRQSSGPAPLIDHIAYTIADYGADDVDPSAFKETNAAVKAELDARGFVAEPESELSWAFKDPDGFKVQVAPELMHPGHPMFDAIFSRPRQ